MKKIIILALICASFTLQAQTYKTVTMALDTATNVAKLRAGLQTLDLNNTYQRIQDGLISGGEATIGVGSVTIDTAIYRINKINYTSLPRTFTGIANSPSGTQYYLIVYGEIGGTLDTLSGVRDSVLVLPTLPINTVAVNTIIVGSGGVESSVPVFAETLQSVTDRGRITTKSLNSTGQGRFAGWYQTGDLGGAAAEIGYTDNSAFVIGYDRTSLAYKPLTFGSSYSNFFNANLGVGYNTDQLYKFAVNGTGYFNGLLSTGTNVGVGTNTGFNGVSGTETTLHVANTNVASLYLNSTVSNKYAIYAAADGTLNFNNLTVGNTPLSFSGAGNATFGGIVTATSLTATGLTSGRIPYVSTSGLIKDEAGFTYDETLNAFAVAGTISGGNLAINGGQSTITSSGNIGISAANDLSITAGSISLNNTLPARTGNFELLIKNTTSSAVQKIAQGGLVESSAGTLTIAHATDYVFTGTTTTWTLPSINASLTGRLNQITIKNRGTGAITLNSASGNTIYALSATNTITINAGEAYTLIPDSTYFNVF